MAATPRPVVCRACFVRRELVPVGRNFFPGCLRYRCARCGTLFLYPLPAAAAAVGWTMCIAFAVSSVTGWMGLRQSDALTDGIGGALAFVLLVGLVRDLMVRNGVAVAERAYARGEGAARE